MEITISGDIPPGQTFSADLSNRPFSAALAALSQQLKGNVVCRIGLLTDDSGMKAPTITIDLRSRARR